MAELLKLVSLCVITREPVVPTKTFNYTRISDSLSPKQKPCPLPFPVGVTLENDTLHMHPPQPETPDTALPILLILPHIRPSALHRHNNWELYPVPVTI